MACRTQRSILEEVSLAHCTVIGTPVDSPGLAIPIDTVYKNVESIISKGIGLLTSACSYWHWISYWPRLAMHLQKQIEIAFLPRSTISLRPGQAS